MDIQQLYLDSRLNVFADLLVEWNQKFNLTAIKGRDEIFTKHFLDSLLGLDYFPTSGNILDIGSGAGLPAIVLKLFRQQCSFTLVEAVNKKVIFLREVISRLSLTNIEPYHLRIEELKQLNYFDAVTARALAPLNILCEYALPFLKIGGRFIAYKGRESETLTELKSAQNALKILGGTVEKVEKKVLDNSERTFVIITKARQTPPQYPRKLNKPRLQPL